MRNAEYVEIRVTVDVQNPEGEWIRVNWMNSCEREHADYMRARMREQAIHDLNKKDLIFGCCVGRLSIKTEPREYPYAALPSIAVTEVSKITG